MGYFLRRSVLVLFVVCQMAMADELAIPECSGCIVTQETTIPADLPPLCESCITPPLHEESSILRSDFPE